MLLYYLKKLKIQIVTFSISAKNFEKLLRFDTVTESLNVGTFLRHSVLIHCILFHVILFYFAIFHIFHRALIYAGRYQCA